MLILKNKTIELIQCFYINMMKRLLELSLSVLFERWLSCSEESQGILMWCLKTIRNSLEFITFSRSFAALHKNSRRCFRDALRILLNSTNNYTGYSQSYTEVDNR